MKVSLLSRYFLSTLLTDRYLLAALLTDR